MKITEDVRKYAAEVSEQEVLVGLETKAKEFREAGGELYVKP